MSAAGTDRYNVSAVERALDVLNAFTHQRPELSLTDIAKVTKLHKATAFRHWRHCAKGGMAMKNPAMASIDWALALSHCPRWRKPRPDSSVRPARSCGKSAMS